MKLVVLWLVAIYINEARGGLKRSEANWGRLYLKNGVEPIQYFKANYGNPMPEMESKLYFPSQSFGCEEYSAQDKENIKSNSTIVIVDRGDCSYADKSMLAASAGAKALIVVTHGETTDPPYSGEVDTLQLPTVAMRHSGGSLLRAAVKRDAVYARLIPIGCDKQNGKLKCQPFNVEEVEYANEQAMGGYVVNGLTGNSMGEFLAATFGAPILSKSFQVVHDTGCRNVSGKAYNGKVAVLEGGDCSSVEKVMMAMKGGALGVAFVDTSAYGLARAALDQQWMGYNLTLPVISVSKILAKALKVDQWISLSVENQVAEQWNEIQDLRALEGWPTRKSRRETMMQSLLKKYIHLEKHRKALEYYFINVAGGSQDALNKMKQKPLIKDDL